MDLERKKTLRSIKVIASEAVMVVAVIIMVIVLAFLVSGYWINSDFKVDRQGLMQLSSLPTGANVSIDGVPTSWLERTNLSKSLSSGEHTIELSRDGYDTWSKTITISEGLLYRLHYPRLFLLDRSKETVLDVADFSSASISPDHNYLLLLGNTTLWNTVNLNNETIKPTKIDVAPYFMATANLAKTPTADSTANPTTDSDSAEPNPADPSSANTSTAAVFSGQIESVNWDRDSSHALLKAKFGDSVEWVLLDIKNPKNSINITREFGSNFSDIKILDNSANNLLVVQNGNLHKLDLGAKSISNVLVENIEFFDHYNQNEIVFSAKRSNAPEGEPAYYLGSLQIGNPKIKELDQLDQPSRVAISKFYEDKFITTLIGDALDVHKNDDFSLVASFKLTFSPENLLVGHNGEFLTMSAGSHLATLDMEAMAVSEWDVDGAEFGWISDDMIYTVKDGQLIVFDYDGLNRRTLANNVSSRFPVSITDDKWLYYFSDDQLTREWLIPR